jgi:hypothetical protein
MSFCRALTAKFHENRYASLLLTAQGGDAEEGWLFIPQDTPDLLSKACSLAELRHMDLVMIHATKDSLSAEQTLLPDMIVSFGLPQDAHLARRMTDEDNLWITLRGRTADEAVEEAFHTLVEES